MGVSNNTNTKLTNIPTNTKKLVQQIKQQNSQPLLQKNNQNSNASTWFERMTSTIQGWFSAAAQSCVAAPRIKTDRLTDSTIKTSAKNNHADEYFTGALRYAKLPSQLKTTPPIQPSSKSASANQSPEDILNQILGIVKLAQDSKNTKNTINRIMPESTKKKAQPNLKSNNVASKKYTIKSDLAEYTLKKLKMYYDKFITGNNSLKLPTNPEFDEECQKLLNQIDPEIPYSKDASEKIITNGNMRPVEVMHKFHKQDGQKITRSTEIDDKQIYAIDLNPTRSKIIGMLLKYFATKTIKIKA